MKYSTVTDFKGKDKNQKLKKAMEEILLNLCSVVRTWKIKRQNDPG